MLPKKQIHLLFGLAPLMKVRRTFWVIPKRLYPVIKPLLLLCSLRYKELLIVLKILPIFGPSRRTIAITTTATSTRMIAYSTSPCPLSCGYNNMDEFLSEKIIRVQK
jgi:hypothetical protein